MMAFNTITMFQMFTLNKKNRKVKDTAEESSWVGLQTPEL